VLSAIFFMRWWGIAGAAASIVIGFAAASVVTCLSYRSFLGRKMRVSTTED
jgi:hypothetical protein